MILYIWGGGGEWGGFNVIFCLFIMLEIWLDIFLFLVGLKLMWVINSLF